MDRPTLIASLAAGAAALGGHRLAGALGAPADASGAAAAGLAAWAVLRAAAARGRGR